MTTPHPDLTAARDALLAKFTTDWDIDPWGEYESARARLADDLDNLIALARTDLAARAEALEGALRDASLGWHEAMRHGGLWTTCRMEACSKDRALLSEPTPAPVERCVAEAGPDGEAIPCNMEEGAHPHVVKGRPEYDHPFTPEAPR